MASTLDLPFHAQLAADLAHRAQRVNPLLLAGGTLLLGDDLGVEWRGQARNIGGLQGADESKPHQRHA
ncbi:hypothetical protein D3C81_1956420 [compost metagenome]